MTAPTDKTVPSLVERLKDASAFKATTIPSGGLEVTISGPSGLSLLLNEAATELQSLQQRNAEQAEEIGKLKSVYISAVKGRSAFRDAFRKATARVEQTEDPELCWHTSEDDPMAEAPHDELQKLWDLEQRAEAFQQRNADLEGDKGQIIGLRILALKKRVDIWAELNKAEARATLQVAPLIDAAIAFVRAKDAAHEYGVTMPAQTPYPERLVASEASEAARAQLIAVAENLAKVLLKSAPQAGGK